MRFVSHWPLGVPLLFLAPYFTTRARVLRCPLCGAPIPPGTSPLGHVCRPTGTRPAGGFRKLCAYTQRKVLGMRTLAMAITAGCSSLLRRGNRSADERSRTLRALVNSYSGHGLSIDATATPGASGQRRELAA